MIYCPREIVHMKRLKIGDGHIPSGSKIKAALRVGFLLYSTRRFDWNVSRNVRQRLTTSQKESPEFDMCFYFCFRLAIAIVIRGNNFNKLIIFFAHLAARIFVTGLESPMKIMNIHNELWQVCEAARHHCYRWLGNCSWRLFFQRNSLIQIKREQQEAEIFAAVLFISSPDQSNFWKGL